MRCGAILITVLFTVLLSSETIRARVFFTGSNPSLTVFAFPQDIFLMPGEQVFFYGAYQFFPWWGDIDEPENKPNKEYILTGEKTESSKHYEAINQFQTMVGFMKFIKDSMKLRFDLDYTSSHLKADAEGLTSTYGSLSPNLPYTYRGRNAIRDLYLTAMLATHYKNLPIGFKIGIGVQRTSKPDLELYLFNGGQTTRSSMLLWGWNGDSYQEQDNFNIGSLYKFDAQASATFPRHKIGGRLRYYIGNLSNYQWGNDGYVINPQKIRNITGRLYGIYNWYQRDKFKFNTTVLSRYTFIDSMGLARENPGIETGVREEAKTFVFQINPNINIYPWNYPMTYIDAAILCNFSHMSYDYLQPYYVDGGYKDGYVGTGNWSREDYSWENFSYGRENFFELALDINAAIPVIGMRNQSVAFGLSMFLWRRYKWLDKYFGHTDVVNNDLKFNVETKRENFDRETWLNSVINIIYRRDKYFFRLDIGQPLIYSLTPRTRLTGTGGAGPYEKTRDNMWLSQSGMKIGLFVSTSLENFRSFRIFHPSDKEK